ncbi:CapA family protein [Parenemella sanctibonifatiensis]|uniref:Poly-gamma-glutamate biosynthesis protein n=1 Tax=Parenemella sanctibonifatiensis TaxID=2016505 RepID=A0A255EKF2_9ACTN|nr:CapA family protein [Parenemella sanctibonifatiensis]OYN88244.1 poly-gamma-glutamate biosynthesis protein [Parenemella sanctibonifatiensis]OYN89922.1 poly-gamma-glutamate biosynthesis protein [Parenemella sanctibonifatiensis]
MALTGDMLWHDLLWQQALTDGGGSHDFAPQLEALSPATEADLAVAHQEVPVGEPDGPFENYPAVVVPPQTLDGLRRVGFHAITTASNHSMDGGHVGLGRTLDAADRAGLAHAGTARSAEEQATPSIVTTASGVRIGLVAGAYGLNGYRLDRDKQWAWNGLDPDLMAADAARCRAAGADLVIAAVHAGVEYQTEPTSQQREVAHRLAESPDIDLVYGHHAHAVQPWEDHNGTWILYGLGNAMAAQSTKEPRTREGAIARITFRHDPTAGWWLAHAAYVPTLIQARPWRVYPLGAPEVSHRHRVEVGERTYRAITSWGAAGIYPVLHGL